MKLGEKYWSRRYRNNETGWDLGRVSPPIKAYIDRLKDKNMKILIPGAGNSHEAGYLFRKGFTNIDVVEIAEEPLANFKKRLPEFPLQNLLKEDFFNIQGEYDLVLEQTFFCALPPGKREAYASKMSQLLTKYGRLAGVLFDTYFDEEGPPFGGSKAEYEDLFAPYLHIKTLETCYNSVTPRLGNELFFIFIKK